MEAAMDFMTKSWNPYAATSTTMYVSIQSNPDTMLKEPTQAATTPRPGLGII